MAIMNLSMDVKYTWILWRQIVVNLSCNFPSLVLVELFIQLEGRDVLKVGKRKIVILARYRVHCIIEHENLMEDQSYIH